MNKIRTMLFAAAVTTIPVSAHAGDAALSPLPYLGAVIAHQGNEALRIIREQIRDDIRAWLPPSLDAAVPAPAETRQPPKG